MMLAPPPLCCPLSPLSLANHALAKCNRAQMKALRKLALAEDGESECTAVVCTPDDTRPLVVQRALKEVSARLPPGMKGFYNTEPDGSHSFLTAPTQGVPPQDADQDDDGGNDDVSARPSADPLPTRHPLNSSHLCQLVTASHRANNQGDAR